MQVTRRENSFLAYGFRYERAPVLQSGEPRAAEHRASLVATGHVSDFQRVRLELAYDRRPQERSGFEVMLQLEFAIGAHGGQADWSQSPIGAKKP